MSDDEKYQKVKTQQLQRCQNFIVILLVAAGLACLGAFKGKISLRHPNRSISHSGMEPPLGRVLEDNKDLEDGNLKENVRQKELETAEAQEF